MLPIVSDGARTLNALQTLHPLAASDEAVIRLLAETITPEDARAENHRVTRAAFEAARTRYLPIDVEPER